MPDFPPYIHRITWNIPHGHQQVQIVLLNLLAPHQDGTKQVRRCNYSTYALDHLWAALP